MGYASMQYDVYCGIDVGKTMHYLVALDKKGGKRLLSTPLAQDEVKIRKTLEELFSFGSVLVIVDQSGSFGRPVISVAKSLGMDVAHLPPKIYHDAAKLYGEGTSDAKAAYVIADVSRVHPSRIVPVTDRGESLEKLDLFISWRDNLVDESTALFNRTHDLLHQICPPLEALFSKKSLHTQLALKILERYGGPEGLKKAGQSRVTAWAGKIKRQKTRGPAKVIEVFAAIEMMTVTIEATSTAEEYIRQMASRLLSIKDKVAQLEKKIDGYAAVLPEAVILMSVPGIGRVYGPVIAVEIGDIKRFSNPGELAYYGGVTPKKSTSGTSVNKKSKAKGGNRKLKNALVGSAEKAILHDATSRAYYEKKRAEGKSYRSAVLALARRRVDLIYALLPTGSCYEPPNTA
jgi:transposase